MPTLYKTILRISFSVYLFSAIHLIAFFFAGINYNIIVKQKKAPNINFTVERVVQDIPIWTQIDPQKKYILYFADTNEGKKLFRLHTSQGKAQIIYPIGIVELSDDFSLEFVSWAPDGRQATFIQKSQGVSEFLVIDIESLDRLFLFDIAQENFEKMQWDQKSSLFVYGLRNNVVSQIDLKEEAKNVVLASLLSDYTVWHPNIYFTKNDQTESMIRTKLISEISEGQGSVLPRLSHYTFTDITQDFILLKDGQSNAIYILDKIIFDKELDFNKSLDATVNAFGFEWSADEKNIVFHNGFEISVYDVGEKTLEVLERSGRNIQEAKFFGKDIIYSASESLYIIQEKSDVVSTTEIASFDSINSFYPDASDNTVFVWGAKDQTNGLYKIVIQ